MDPTSVSGVDDLEKQTKSETGPPDAVTAVEAAAAGEKPGARVGLGITQFWIVLFG
jgi:hypothetical protein